MPSSAAAVFITVLLTGTCIYLIRYLRVNVLNPEGKGAYKATARLLRQLGGLRGCRALSGISLGGETERVENMLIGRFGVLLVTTVGARGAYYGEVDSKQWTIVRESARTALPNPLLAQEKQVAALRALLSREKVYNVPVEYVTCLSSASNKTEVYITRNEHLLLPGRLRGYLAALLDREGRVDVERVAGVIAGTAEGTAKS